MGPAEVQTTARQANPSMAVAGHRSTAPAHLVRALVPAVIHPTPDCGSRMTGTVTYGSERAGGGSSLPLLARSLRTRCASMPSSMSTTAQGRREGDRGEDDQFAIGVLSGAPAPSACARRQM